MERIFFCQIAQNIRQCFKELTKTGSTKKRKTTQESIDMIIKASAHNPTTEINDVLQCCNVRDWRNYENIIDNNRCTKKRRYCVIDIASKCVDEFAHDDVCARIDTNQLKFKTVNNQKHPMRT